ncbi:beta-ketoacyl-[acyl-carrier-protein] synthase family protein [Lacrimispora sp.]|uniref:beta-ketoacyl-[acyl-carrier-protein] synthase family protein n=1 Tax=Lacrimispora sp. TaxID=2719234 RepID=UPI00399100C9
MITKEDRKVVVTGMGMITPIGNNVEQSWKNLLKEESGIKRITLFDTEGFSCKIAGQVKDDGYRSDLPYSRGTYFGLAASKEALKDAEVVNEAGILDEMAVFLGNSGTRTGLDDFSEEFKARNLKELTLKNLNSDSQFDKSRYSAAAETIAKECNLSGGCCSITTACASGTQAIGMAYESIKAGENTVVLAGGCDAMITEIDLMGFCMLGAVTSEYNENPTKGSRPFNKDRSGFVLGEGAGMLVLEEKKHALARKAKIYAEIVGFGNAISGYSILDTPPDGENLAQAMKIAMDEAGINKNQIGYINAHGTSTRDNDSSEAAAVIKVFGEDVMSIPISSTKASTGHLISGAGAIEAIFSIMALKDQCLPPTLNLEDIDGKCTLFHIPKPLKRTIDYVMSNSL